MSRPRRYRTPEEHQWVSLGQIAKEIDRSPGQTAKLLTKTGFIGYKARRGANRTTQYDARALEVLKGLLGIPHRHVSDVADDWLSNWVSGGGNHG